MMTLLYNLSIYLYRVAITVVSPFNSKAKQWITGRKGIYKRLSECNKDNRPVVWFHVASLGEFEQGRPVIEAFRKKYPNYFILLTFFSPSGYEIRKEYDGVDCIFYLPLDTPKNAKQFIDIIKPSIAFFIKYDFWYNYLNQLHKREIPVYIFSAIFRKEQLFFKWYGKWYRRMLSFFTKIYVQNKESLHLLRSIGINSVEIGGDTRFDRVYDIVKSVKPNAVADRFTNSEKVIVAGSTWPKDEELIVKYIENNRDNIKWIIAPHEIHESHINGIEKMLHDISFVRYTKVKEGDDISDKQVLIVDTIGVLSSLYSYGIVAYIGGGFGKGIHNTLEAATFGIPVVFGPNYRKFKEARELIDAGAAFSISEYREFEKNISTIINDENLRKKSGHAAYEYTNSMRGGTKLIIDEINKLLLF